jgi:hypothetical protein
LSLILASLACNWPEQPEAPPPTPTAAPTEAPSTPEAELVSIDPARAWETGALDSYRAEFTLAAHSEDDPENPSLRTHLWLEVTRSPSTQHYILETEIEGLTDEIASLTTETYLVEGVLYSRNSVSEEWNAIKGDLVSLTEEIFLNPQDFVFLPATAHREPSPEQVNGVEAWHYSFDEGDFQDSPAQWDVVQTEAWISVEGGYVVKLEATMQSSTGASLELPEAAPVQTGYTRMIVSYDMTDINAPFSITLPEEAAQAEVHDLSEGFLGSWSRADVPLPEGAEIAFSFEDSIQALTDLPVQEAIDWMKANLADQGWSLEVEEKPFEDLYTATFEKGGERLSLQISLQEDRTSLFLSVEGDPD